MPSLSLPIASWHILRDCLRTGQLKTPREIVAAGELEDRITQLLIGNPRPEAAAALLAWEREEVGRDIMDRERDAARVAVRAVIERGAMPGAWHAAKLIMALGLDE